jgi:DNA-binding NarL/FixJ family response regulator
MTCGEGADMAGDAVTERSNSRHPVIRPPGFTGRARELAELTDALSGPPGMVLVEGEAGIGKSRLIQEFLSSPAGRQHRALVATCPPFRRPHTLGPVADALRQVVGDVPGLRLSALAGALRPLFPEWAGSLPPAPESAEDATAARHRLFAALAELIGSLGVTVIVAEDAHWADEATLEFLVFLASSPPPPPATAPRWAMTGMSATPTRPGVLGRPSLLLTVRPEDVPAGSLLPRLARLAAGTSGLRITLGTLELDDTAGMVSSMLAADQVSDDFAAFMHEHTGGVPLAVEESVRLMAARADLRRLGGQWVRRELTELPVPPPVRDVVLERAGGLGPGARAVLRAAAVLGEPVAATTVLAVAGIDCGRAGAGLSEALACQLLDEDGRGLVSFRHVLAARAVYESISGPDRRVLHLRAGRALEGLPSSSLAQLARHFREAGDTRRWCHYGERAADLALAAGDETTAAVALHDLVTSPGLRPSAVARLVHKIALLALPEDGQLASLAGALRAVLGARGAGPAEEALLRFQLGRLLATMNQADASRAELERAVAGLPPGSVQAARAMTLLGWPQGSTCPAREHLRWLRRAAATAASVPPPERLRLVADRAAALLLLGEQSGWAEAARIPWEVSAPGERLQITRGHGNIGEIAMVWGRFGEARRRLTHAVVLAGRYGYPRLHASVLAVQAHLDWLTGAWDGLADRAAELAGDDDLQMLNRLPAVLVIGLLSAAAGAREQAVRELRQVVDEAGRLGAVEYVIEPAAALARLHLAEDDVSQALKVTDEPADIVARKKTWIWATDLAPARVAALAAAGRPGEAAALTAALARGLRGRDVPAPRAGLALCRATVAEDQRQHVRAAALFARAADAWQALPRPYDALLARERQARCLLAAGRQPAGLALLSDVLAGLARLGAAGDAERVAGCLREHGAAPWRGWRGGRRGYGSELSPRELEVVRLVADGRTSREIGHALHRSPKTVDMQVKSAMRKLGVTSRTALAARVTAMGGTGGSARGPTGDELTGFSR